MSIIRVMTIATDAIPSRCRQPIATWLAAALLALATLASPASAGGPSTTKHEPTKASTDAQTDDAPQTKSERHALRNGIRLEDEIEVVNTRSICSCTESALRNGLKFETYAVCDDAGARKWQPSDLENFLSFDPAVPTVVFVHGNQITPGDAKSEGLFVYRQLVLQDPDAPRFRLVIFSWPSMKTAGLLRDVREKAARTEPAGWHLAWLLDQMHDETPVGLVGFSFGSRIITGGLHILAGGSLGNLKLAEREHPHRAPVNVALIASAEHSYWLAPGQHHGKAMSVVDRALLINNCADRAMRYYDLITPGRGGPQALGLRGPTRIGPEDADKIFNRDVSGYVGSDHDFTRYICAPGDAALIWDYTGPKATTKIGG